jgi:hypothetical protein
VSKYVHSLKIEVNFRTKEELLAFWSHLHGGNDVLLEMERGIYAATGTQPHVDITPSEEDGLTDMVSSVTEIPRAS